MPAETHQFGRVVDPAIVAEYLHALLDDESDSDEAGVALAAFGVHDEDIEWLWEAVCDEFAERTLGPELEPGLIVPDLTIDEAAARIAAVLGRGSRDADR